MNDVSLMCDVGCLEWCIQFSFLEKILARVVVEDEDGPLFPETLEFVLAWPRFHVRMAL